MSGRDHLSVVANAVAGVLETQFSLFLNEKQSHLGFESHCKAVLRRIATGEPGAVILDAHYLLSLDAHTEELEMQRRAKSRKRMSEPPTGAPDA